MSDYPSIVRLGQLDGADGFRLDGVANLDGAGRSVAFAGDVNGDGFGDLIIGAPAASPGGNGAAGSAFVVFGKAGAFGAHIDLASLGAGDGVRLDGLAEHDVAGQSVAGVGDVNGDGVADFVIGASGTDYSSGAAYLVFGKPGGFASPPDLATLDGSDGVRLDGGGYDFAGLSVHAAGDINGDGVDDLVVGALHYADLAGVAYVVFGKASAWGGSLDLTTLNGTQGFKIKGADVQDYADIVSGGGDINGDGIDDLIVGASGADPGGRTDAGSTYVIFGKASGWGTVDLGAPLGAAGFRIDGAAAYDSSGVAVSSAGDINGDGLDDVIIGERSTYDEAGAAYVVFGRKHASGAIDLGALDGTNGFKLAGVPGQGHAGLAVSNAGDVNGDGFDDLVIGAPDAAVGAHAHAGESYVVFGKAGGWAPSLSLGALNGDDGFIIRGHADGERSGAAVAGGDLNGDGFSDILIGAPQAPGDAASAGAAYVVFGAEPGQAVTRVGSAIGQTIHGGGFNDVLKGKGGDDVLIGHGGADRLSGGDGSDAFVFARLDDSTKAAPDLISDLSDSDVIDLSAIDANAATAENDAFVLVSAFDRHPGEAVLKAAGSNTVLRLDVTGDGAPDMVIRIAGDHSGFDNFVL